MHCDARVLKGLPVAAVEPVCTADKQQLGLLGIVRIHILREKLLRFGLHGRKLLISWHPLCFRLDDLASLLLQRRLSQFLPVPSHLLLHVTLVHRLNLLLLGLSLLLLLKTLLLDDQHLLLFSLILLCILEVLL